MTSRIVPANRCRQRATAWCEPHRTELDFETTLDVRYIEDGKVGLLVPAAMQEQYLRTAQPKADHLEVSSTCTNFRRFEVLGRRTSSSRSNADDA